MSAPTIVSHGSASSLAIGRLSWVLAATATVVVLVVAGLLLMALFRRRVPAVGISDDGEAAGRRWIVIGAGVSVVILLGIFAYTLTVLTDYARGGRDPGLTVRVTGYRYWWKLEYLAPSGATDFVTANELHIPAGMRVRLQLLSGDVIHSFWVPALAGKTDLIPGQTNTMWIEADSAGRLYGQCAEFCGLAHANMRLAVVVDDGAGFARWEHRQREPARTAPDSLFFERGCAACHTIRGSAADGDAGPDLTHLASRATIAAGVLPNTAAALDRWLSAPDSIKPGVLMPRTGLTDQETTDVNRYLRGLR